MVGLRLEHLTITPHEYITLCLTSYIRTLGQRCLNYITDYLMEFSTRNESIVVKKLTYLEFSLEIYISGLFNEKRTSFTVQATGAFHKDRIVFEIFCKSTTNSKKSQVLTLKNELEDFDEFYELKRHGDL